MTDTKTTIFDALQAGDITQMPEQPTLTLMGEPFYGLSYFGDRDGGVLIVAPESRDCSSHDVVQNCLRAIANVVVVTGD